MNPQKTIINGQEYELVPAEVIDVDFSGQNKSKLYTIVCKLIGAFGSQAASNLVQARAIDANIKNIPITGEIVLLLRSPTANNSYFGTSQEYYYTNPISIRSSVHHNGLPGATEVSTRISAKDEKKRTNAQDGINTSTNKRLAVKSKIDSAFPERLDVYPIQPYSGDIILEGRWGQSIRFGSTVDERRTYPVKPLWQKGLGETGNPILIISNGTNPKKKKFNEFISENPDEDDASIWMTSGQSVRFKQASMYTPSIKDKEVELYKKNEFGGNQVIITSDRIIFNAKKQEILAYSKESIGLSSEKIISIDGKELIETESKRINLGLNATSPVLLGDRTMDWLNTLCDILSKFMTTTTLITVPTGVGPSGPPINTPVFLQLRTNLVQLQQEIEKLQSRLAFVNEKSNGPSEDSRSSASDRESIREQRESGQEPPRKKTDPQGTDLADKVMPTGVMGAGLTLQDPTETEDASTGQYATVYGERGYNPETWEYDKRYNQYLDETPTEEGGNKRPDSSFDSQGLKDKLNYDKLD
jgi:hypothetical protein